MNYVVISEKNEKPPKPSEMMHSLTTKKPEQQAHTEEASEQAAKQAWETYKALAAGKPSFDKAAEKPPPPKQPRTAGSKPPDAKPTVGIAGLLEKYQQTKAKRSQMNTLVVNPPSGQ